MHARTLKGASAEGESPGYIPKPLLTVWGVIGAQRVRGVMFCLIRQMCR